jgi:hypothetical protein
MEFKTTNDVLDTGEGNILRTFVLVTSFGAEKLSTIFIVSKKSDTVCIT